MESTSKKQNTPKLWYWGEPKGGMSLEDGMSYTYYF